MDVSILRNELRILEEKKRAIESLLSCYENGAIESKPKEKKYAVGKKRIIRKKSDGQTFHSKVYELAIDLAGRNSGTVNVKQLLDMAIEKNIIPNTNRARWLQRVSGVLVTEKNRGHFERIRTGNYQMIKANVNQ